MATKAGASRSAQGSRRRPVRSVLSAASAVLLVVTVASLVTNDPLHRAATRTVAAANGPTALPTATAGPATSTATGGGATTGGGSNTAGGPGSSAATGPAVSAPPPGSSTGPTSPGPTGSTSPTPGTSVAVFSPTLRLFALGGRVLMPLVCSVAAGAVGPALTDPNIAAIAAQVVATCVTQANQGADGLVQLDRDLNQLAAINPTVRPALEQLAAALDTASQDTFPFASLLSQYAALVRFFSG